DEKRNLAPAPDFVSKVLHGDGRLAQEANRWFDDRMGFRPLFVRLHNQIDYTLFGHSDKVYIGRDNTLFLRSFVDTHISIERQGDAWRHKLQDQFLKLAGYLRSRNIRLVIVSNPDKSTVQSDLLPTDAPLRPPVTQFDKLRNFLRENSQWSYVDGVDVFAHCGHYRPFYRTDIHSTTPAGDCMAKQIVARIAELEQLPADFWNPTFSYHTEAWSSGGLTSFMSIMSKITEQIDIRDSDSSYMGGPAPGGLLQQDPAGFFETIYRADSSLVGRKLPPMILYGNSFVDPFLESGLYFQFAEVYRVRSNGIPVEAMLRRLPSSTRYVVVQFLEAFLNN